MSRIPRHMTLGDFIRANGIPPTFADGVIVEGVELGAGDLELLERANIPAVFLPCFNRAIDAPQVGSDSARGMELCLKTLMDYGHRDIGLMNCTAGFHDFPINLEVFRRVQAERGIPFDESKIVCADMTSEEEGAAGIWKLLSRNPGMTGVVLFGDGSAAGAVRKLNQMGIAIPDALSVVVHDRYPWLDLFAPLRLCGVQQNIEGLACALLDTLEKQRGCLGDAPPITLVPPDWIDGNSASFPRRTRIDGLFPGNM